MVRVKISDPEARWYPFPEELKLGDAVESIHGNRPRGKIIDAEYDGTPKEHGGGSFKITYTVQLENGLFFNADELELRKIDC